MSPPNVPLSEHLLGSPLGDPALVQTLASLDAASAWEPDEGIVHWVSRVAGVDLQGNEAQQRLVTIFFFNEGVEGHEQYAGPLPRGVEFAWDRARFAAHLGPPGLHGPKHDCWIAEDHRLIVQYDAKGGVTKITVTRM